ncbi:MAG: methionine--tRNA ligase, partial [Clostridiales bacterium]|nr:methionine--tRNA ligase [Clostridiales bacterium]
HTYKTVAADTITRFKKLTGYKTYFLTGTDEHGQKIERSAKQAGLEPKQYIDGIVEDTKALWKLMNIDYDEFIRTTDERHIKTVKLIFRKLFEQGDIYKGSYEGQYCAQCEAFWTPSQILEGNLCPDCKRPTELVNEESYFFRMSKYQDWLIDYIKSHPDFIQPPSRANEMLQNFLLPGLQDLSVSRTTFSWGVPVDFDPKHVVYVWIDALSNYISALGYGTDNDELYQTFWPAQVHLVGKEIMRFHTIYWPILLHALGLPQPEKIFGHGWLLFGSDKMSKSKGNVVYSQPIVARYGADALRYYLMREMTFGMDGNYTNEAYVTRTNADLANDLGNLVSRTVAMIEKYFAGIVPVPNEYLAVDLELIEIANNLPAQVEKEMDLLQFSAALQEIWKLISACNRYIDTTQPWVLGRDESGKSRLSTVLYVLAECIRFVAVCIGPVMPSTPARIYAQLGLADLNLETWDSLSRFGNLHSGIKVEKGEALFPRVDIAKELEALADDQEDKSVKSREPEEESLPTTKPSISIDEFEKLDLRVAKVLTCETVPKSDKLLKFSLQLGDE